MTAETAANRPRILVFRIGSLGDTLVALPCLYAIREQHPNAEIKLLTNEPVDHGIQAVSSATLLGGTGLVDFVIPYIVGAREFRGILGLLLRLRREKIDWLYYVMPSRNFGQRLRDWLFFGLVGARNVRGLRLSSDQEKHYDDKSNLIEPESKRLLRSIGFPAKLSRSSFDLRLTDAETNQSGTLVDSITRDGNRDMIFVCVGGKSPLKDWGRSNWAWLLGRLQAANPNALFVFVGAASEARICEQIAKDGRVNFSVLCGQLSPRGTAAAFKKGLLLLTHDSGPMHLASVVGLRCVSVFAGVSPRGQWYPFGNEDLVLYPEARCTLCTASPCLASELGLCIRSITREEVFDVAVRALANRNRFETKIDH